MTALNGQIVNNAVDSFMQNHFADYIPTPYTKFSKNIDAADKLTASLYIGEMSLEDVLKEADASDAGNVLDRLTQLFRDIHASNETISPDNFRNQVAVLENEVIDWNKHYNPDETQELNIYSATLATLAIAKYRYEYWYNVREKLDDPWHIVIPDDEPVMASKPGGFWQRLWNGICTAANAVWNALCTPVANASGAWSTLTPYTYLDEGGYKTGYIGNLREFCHGGISASASVWSNFP